MATQSLLILVIFWVIAGPNSVQCSCDINVYKRALSLRKHTILNTHLWFSNANQTGCSKVEDTDIRLEYRAVSCDVDQSSFSRMEEWISLCNISSVDSQGQYQFADCTINETDENI